MADKVSPLRRGIARNYTYTVEALAFLDELCPTYKGKGKVVSELLLEKKAALVEQERLRKLRAVLWAALEETYA
jgi:hypothetical protein